MIIENLQNDKKNQKQDDLSIQKTNNNGESEQANKLLNETISTFNNKYKKHLEILIRMFVFQNGKRQKISNFDTNLCEQNKETVYLINNDWLEKFKSFFEYQDLEYFLKEKSNIDKINSDSDKVIFQQIINGLSMEYFNKIIQKQIEKHEEIDKTIENIYQENSIIKIGENLCDMKFLCNFQIVNHKINKSLMALLKDTNEYIIDLYYIGNNKLLLRFPETMNNIFCDEIGIINENKIFIPQYVLYYINKIEDSVINKFLSKNFNNFSEDSHKLHIQIFDSNKFIMGYCFSMTYLIKKKEEGNVDNQNEIEQDIINDENKSKNIIHDINSNEESISNKKKIESIIEVILLINKFEKEIDIKLNESLNSKENKVEESILIRQEWLDKFKEIYINEEIKRSLINIDTENIDSNINLLYSGSNQKKEYINKINESKFNISTNDMICFDTNKLMKLSKNSDIFYPKDFCMININIYKKLLKIFKIDERNELNNDKTYNIKYIINNRKIIFSYEYHLNDDNNIIYYNILICEKKINNNKINPIIIKTFEDKKDKRDEIFKQYIETQFSLGTDNGDIDDEIIVIRILNKENYENDVYLLITIFLRKKM